MLSMEVLFHEFGSPSPSLATVTSFCESGNMKIFLDFELVLKSVRTEEIANTNVQVKF